MSNFHAYPWKTVLITGGAGFIGAHLVSRFLSEGWRVQVLDDLSTGRRENLPDDPNLTFLRGSVMEPDDLRQAKPVELVLHLAGIVGMRLAHEQRELAFRVADEGTRQVVESTGGTALVLFMIRGFAGVACR